MDIGPCDNWPLAECCCDLTAVSPTITGIAHAAATEILWGLSGRQFGECTVTNMRPCRDTCDGTPVGMPWPNPTLRDGLWYNLGCGGGCFGDCSCNDESQFTLPERTSRIIEISIGGVPMATGSYRLDNNRYVMRVDGGVWPDCNDGTWLVSAVFGAEVPAIGMLATAELTCELVRLCGGHECGLPTTARTVTRQQVSVNKSEVASAIAGGLVTLPFISAFLDTVNPKRLQSNARSYSPDNPRPRHSS